MCLQNVRDEYCGYGKIENGRKTGNSNRGNKPLPIINHSQYEINASRAHSV